MNDINASAFGACFSSSQRPSKIGPTAENAAIAIPLSSPFLGFKIHTRYVIEIGNFSAHTFQPLFFVYSWCEVLWTANSNFHR